MVSNTKLKHRAIRLNKDKIMLGFIAKQLTAVISSTVDAGIYLGSAVIDDVTSIPDEIAKGWNDGLMSEDEPLEADAATPSEIVVPETSAS